MFAVIFEVHPHQQRWDDYLGHASLLRPELLKIDGFIANERFASHGRPGWLVSLSVWRDEKALIRWRTHALHSDIQAKGRASVFADYHLRVGEIVSDTQPGPVLAQQRSDFTEVGAAKVLMLTERAFDPDSLPPSGSVEADIFDSITRPGYGLYLTGWRDQDKAETAQAGLPGRHRLVRVIRDYGMFARTEAPQYYPPVCPVRPS
jgi:heme-degrading monooxygenase HmoA